MSGGSTAGALDRGRSWVAESDARLLLIVSLGLYALFTVFSALLGLDLNGTISTLERITFFSAVYAMLVLALNLQWGYAGLFNIGVAGFMAIGVYTMSVLSRGVTASPPGLGLPLPIGIIGGMIVAGVFGAVVALPALRLRADYLAIVTLAFAEIIRTLALSRALGTFSVAGAELGLGGRTGMSAPPDPIRHLLYAEPGSLVSPPSALGEWYFSTAASVGIEETVAGSLLYAVLLVAVVAVFYVLLVRVAKSPFGRVLKAIREDEVVAGALGKDVRRFKIKAFALGATLMALGAMLWFMKRGGVAPSNFEPEQTFFIFVALIIGGSGSDTGSVIGGVVFATLLFEGPLFVRRIVDQRMDIGTSPETIFEAFRSTDQLFAYVFADVNLSALRIVLLGVVLTYLIQRRPQGLLGDRKEIASSIDLEERSEGGEEP
jgi:ABC-type branched-subunit amino acid transport system permease subunit